MTAGTMASDALVQEITIVAPAERVFAALTRPEELVRWWTVEGQVRTLAAECDVRPGGGWSMVVEGPCGSGGRTRFTGCIGGWKRRGFWNSRGTGRARLAGERGAVGSGGEGRDHAGAGDALGADERGHATAQ